MVDTCRKWTSERGPIDNYWWSRYFLFSEGIFIQWDSAIGEHWLHSRTLRVYWGTCLSQHRPLVCVWPPGEATGPLQCTNIYWSWFSDCCPQFCVCHAIPEANVGEYSLLIWREESRTTNTVIACVKIEKDLHLDINSLVWLDTKFFSEDRCICQIESCWFRSLWHSIYIGVEWIQHSCVCFVFSVVDVC